MIYESDDSSTTPTLRYEDSTDEDESNNVNNAMSAESEEIIVMPSINTTMSIITRDLTTSSLEDELVQVHSGCTDNKHVSNNPIPKPKIARRRLLPEFKMPSPTALAKLVANRVIKYARCIQNKFENEMVCPTCGLFPVWPVTGACGHTRCIT